MSTQRFRFGSLVLLMAVCLAGPALAGGLSAAFTYQGRLNDSGNPGQGPYDLLFSLHDDPNILTASQVATSIALDEVEVADGYFTVELDFGEGAFDGTRRWLGIGVRAGRLADPNGYTMLIPGQEVTAGPYAIYALKAKTAETTTPDGDWTVAGTDMYSSPSGNVGIGTTNPEYKLDVNGKMKVSSTAYLSRVSDGPYYLDLDGAIWSMWASGNIATMGGLNVGGSSNPGAGNLVVDGNAGIGTSSPQARLHVVGDEARIGTGGTINNATADGDLYVQDTLEVDGSLRIGDSTADNHYFTGKLYSSGSDNDRILPGTANFGYIGDSSNYWFRMYATTIYGSSFYDRDNTDFYVNPAGTSNLNAVNMTGNVNSTGIFNRTAYSGSRYTVMIDTDGYLHRNTSSMRYKENIRPLRDDFAKILGVEPKIFRLKGASGEEIGYIAEEFDSAGLDHLVIYDRQGRPDAIRYDLMSLYLLEVVKDNHETVTELKAENDDLREQLQSENKSLKRRLAALEEMVAGAGSVSAKEAGHDVR